MAALTLTRPVLASDGLAESAMRPESPEAVRALKAKLVGDGFDLHCAHSRARAAVRAGLSADAGAHSQRQFRV
jgi:hypothetical protein